MGDIGHERVCEWQSAVINRGLCRPGSSFKPYGLRWYAVFGQVLCFELGGVMAA